MASGNSSTSRVIVSVVITLGLIPITVILLGPFILHYIGSFLGYLLKKKTEGRRSVLFSVMEDENKNTIQELSDSKSTSSDEWEKVSGAEDNVAEKLKEKTKDWDGIIGFFHPFWYATWCCSVENSS